MKPALILIRVLETIALTSTAVWQRTIEATTGGGIEVSTGWVYRLSLGLESEFTIKPNPIAGAPQVALSTAIVGYALSLVGTLLQKGTAEKSLWTLSLVFSGLGILTYGNELVRNLVGYDLRMIIGTGIVLVVIDWMMLQGTAGGSAKLGAAP